jgi:hypothetical protein
MRGQEFAMRTRRIVAVLVMLAAIVSGAALAWADEPAPPGQPEATPARVSYIHGEVSFWRPGAEEWAEARTNTPLAPGDLLYTGPGGTVEVQFGPRAFVRAGNGAQIGLDNQEPDFVQFRVAAGHAALDLRELAAGHTVEIATPNAAFTVERTGYYHVALIDDTTTFRTHRGGSATMTPAGGAATPIAANQQIVVTGADAPLVETGPAPALTAWDQWNYQRTTYLIHPGNTQHVSPSVYGAEALAQHGSWRSVETYGSVWVPTGVAPDWVPYSTGRWIWDPRFGWSWLDDAPWGWAPYHYGRWVFVGSYWAWAPGPVVVRPLYSPALVVFLGGPVSVSVGVRPLHWAPLGWGEPVIPWWGRPGFAGVAWWGGWGGPRIVNNVVINRTTTVNVTNITVYKNVHVHNAVVAVPADRFAHGRVKPARIDAARVRELTPLRGPLEVKPVAASVMPAGGSAVKPPSVIHQRKVVATRAPRDFTPTLQSQGLGASREEMRPALPRLVPAPERTKDRASAPGGPVSGPGSRERARRDEPSSARRPAPRADRVRDPAPPRPGRGPEAQAPEGTADKVRGPGEKNSRAAAPPARRLQQPPPPPEHDSTTSRPAPPRPHPAQDGAAQRGRPDAKPEPRTQGSGDPRGRGEREQRPPARASERPDRPDQRPGR